LAITKLWYLFVVVQLVFMFCENRKNWIFCTLLHTCVQQ